MKLTTLHAKLGRFIERGWGDRYVIDGDGNDVAVVVPPELVNADLLDERDPRVAVVLQCFVEAR